MPGIQPQPRRTTGAPPSDAIVVGVDGSDGSINAVRWAAGHARAVGARLCLIHAFRESVTATIALPPPAAVGGRALRRRRTRPGRRVVTVAATEARLFASHVEVSGWVEPGGAVEVLAGASAGARLLVVGSRGLGGPTDSLTGSVGLQVTAQAECPTVVVRGAGDANGPVVVAVDGSRRSESALRFGFTEAARRRVGLIAVHAWSLPVLPAEAGSPVITELAVDPDRAALRRVAGRLLAEAVRPYRCAFPHVAVTELLLRNKPEAALPECTEGAVLAVVGSRGHDRMSGLLPGSTSQAMLAGASCPVAVVRGSGIPD